MEAPTLGNNSKELRQSLQTSQKKTFLSRCFADKSKQTATEVDKQHDWVYCSHMDG